MSKKIKERSEAISSLSIQPGMSQGHESELSQPTAAQLLEILVAPSSEVEPTSHAVVDVKRNLKPLPLPVCPAEMTKSICFQFRFYNDEKGRPTIHPAQLMQQKIRMKGYHAYNPPFPLEPTHTEIGMFSMECYKDFEGYLVVAADEFNKHNIMILGKKPSALVAGMQMAKQSQNNTPRESPSKQPRTVSESVVNTQDVELLLEQVASHGGFEDLCHSQELRCTTPLPNGFATTFSTPEQLRPWFHGSVPQDSGFATNSSTPEQLRTLLHASGERDPEYTYLENLSPSEELTYSFNDYMEQSTIPELDPVTSPSQFLDPKAGISSYAAAAVTPQLPNFFAEESRSRTDVAIISEGAATAAPTVPAVSVHKKVAIKLHFPQTTSRFAPPAVGTARSYSQFLVDSVTSQVVPVVPGISVVPVASSSARTSLVSVVTKSETTVNARKTPHSGISAASVLLAPPPEPKCLNVEVNGVSCLHVKAPIEGFPDHYVINEEYYRRKVERFEGAKEDDYFIRESLHSAYYYRYFIPVAEDSRNVILRSKYYKYMPNGYLGPGYYFLINYVTIKRPDIDKDVKSIICRNKKQFNAMGDDEKSLYTRTTVGPYRGSPSGEDYVLKTISVDDFGYHFAGFDDLEQYYIFDDSNKIMTFSEEHYKKLQVMFASLSIYFKREDEKRAKEIMQRRKESEKSSLRIPLKNGVSRVKRGVKRDVDKSYVEDLEQSLDLEESEDDALKFFKKEDKDDSLRRSKNKGRKSRRTSDSDDENESDQETPLRRRVRARFSQKKNERKSRRTSDSDDESEYDLETPSKRRVRARFGQKKTEIKPVGRKGKK